MKNTITIPLGFGAVGISTGTYKDGPGASIGFFELDKPGVAGETIDESLLDKEPAILLYFKDVAALDRFVEHQIKVVREHLVEQENG
jgi:hypothetical protein